MMKPLQPRIGLATIMIPYEVGGGKVETLQKRAAEILAYEKLERCMLLRLISESSWSQRQRRSIKEDQR